MMLNFKTVVWFGVATLIGVLATQAPAQAQAVIRGCMNPAGQVRLVGPADACRSQETLVTWNATGPAGAKGDKGDPGDPGADAPGVTGGADRGPLPGQTPVS